MNDELVCYIATIKDELNSRMTDLWNDNNETTKVSVSILYRIIEYLEDFKRMLNDNLQSKQEKEQF